VFTATVAYDLADGVAPRRGATLSGLAAHVLGTVLAGLGPVQLDAVGTCIKDGSSVPSSGGSHALLVLEASPHLTVGGAA